MLKALLDIFFPPLCHICKGHLADAGDIHVCAPCREKLQFINSPLCSVCGVPFVTAGGTDHPCGPCLGHAPAYTAARSAILFAGGAQELIHRFKYDHNVRLRSSLGLLTAAQLAGFVAEIAPDLLLPVPLHRKRLRWRGYNQAVLLGEILAKEWGVPLQRDNLRRIRWTEPQTHLAAAERARNVRGAFAVRNRDVLEGKRVVLVDDVFTTGSTVEECAATLRRAGTAAVYVVTVARATLIR
jgi:ComF family protein